MEIKLKDMEDIIYAQFDSGQTLTLTIHGTSMYPLFLDQQTQVTMQKQDCYRKGDIIFYRRKNSAFVLHRIIGHDQNGFILMGDNQTIKEHNVTNSMILGKVVEYKTKPNRKTRKVTGLRHRFYSFWWTNLRFIRPILLKVVHLFRK